MPKQKTIGQIQFEQKQKQPITPHEQRIRIQKTKEEAKIEQQIQEIYEEAPIVEKIDVWSRSMAKKPYYAPTPEQVEEIIELAEQLPLEKAEKYVTYEPVQEEPKGVAEFLATEVSPAFQKGVATVVAELMGYSKEEKEALVEYAPKLLAVSEKVTARPLQPVKLIAGLVAPAESLVYGGERLISTYITHHEPITPRPPPTVTGGVIGTIFDAPSELQKAEEYGTSYMAGSLLGDLILGYAISKGIEKTPLGKPLMKFEEKIIGKFPEKIKKLFYKTELEVRRRYSPMMEPRYGRRADFMLKSDLADFIQKTGVKTGVVHTPYAATLEKSVVVQSGSSQLIMQTGKEATRRLPTVTLVEEVAQKVVPLAPKTVVTTVSKTVLAQVVNPFLYAGAAIPQLVKGVSWAEVTKPKLKPYPVMKASPLSDIIVGTRKKVTPLKKEVPIKKTAPIEIPVIDIDVLPVTKVEPVVKVTPAVSPIVEIVQVAKTTQVLETAQITRQQLRHVMSPTARLILGWPPERRKRKRKKKKRKPRKKAKWERYGYLYPVATESQAANWVFGKRKKGKRKK